MARPPPIPGAPKPTAASTRRPARARWRASALVLVTAVLCLWSLFTGDPPLPVLIATAAMPWLAMLMARAEAPSRLVGRRRKNLVAAVMLPGLAVGVVAFGMEEVAVDWRIPLIVALALGAPITVLADAALHGSRVIRGRAVTSLVIFCCMSVYAYGGLSLANARFDMASPERFRAAVLEKRITHGRYSTHWHLRLPPWGPQAEPSEAEVRASVYRAVAVGNSVCIDLHRGAFGIAWYIVERCELRE
jgi:hypothetical protein